MYHTRVATYVLVAIFAVLTDTTKEFVTEEGVDMSITTERRLWSMSNTVSWTTGPDPVLSSIYSDFPRLLRALPFAGALGGDLESVHAGAFINAVASQLSLGFCRRVVDGAAAAPPALPPASHGARSTAMQETPRLQVAAAAFCSRCGRAFGESELFCPRDGNPRASGSAAPPSAATAAAAATGSASASASAAAASGEQAAAPSETLEGVGGGVGSTGLLRGYCGERCSCSK
jgi:hypothetical protein